MGLQVLWRKRFTNLCEMCREEFPNRHQRLRIIRYIDARLTTLSENNRMGNLIDDKMEFSCDTIMRMCVTKQFSAPWEWEICNKISSSLASTHKSLLLSYF